ncbi:hypothetical protein ACFSTE_05930 [Aquimarina hainanensis]|uniref:Uncharacterized protein n=1 Tax=Aquimarina hainanensis TaxID=1578017 RepID=A0ABW5N827_9FLAO
MNKNKIETRKAIKREEVENWLKRNEKMINKHAFDRKIAAPVGTIQKYVRYDKTINQKRIDLLHRAIKSFGKMK